VDALHSLGFRLVDRGDAGVGVGTAHEGHVEHAVKSDVVHVASGALDQRRVLPATDGSPQDAGGLGGRIRNGGHAVTSSVFQSGGGGSSPRVLAAAYSIALTMLWYPVHRQRLPSMAW